MAVRAEEYLHESDKAALKALKEIPGFSLVVKKVMEIGYERMQRITNMSSNLRICENQLPHIYDMLPPICEKLGIAVPELYVTLDPYPNAWTYGDTHPYIVITNSLLEQFSDEEIMGTISHECGHIACNHVLYHTIGNFILRGGISLLRDIPFVSSGFNLAYSYWSRCSELSADRAEAICMGGPDIVVDKMVKFSGVPRNYLNEINREEYLRQAEDYKELVKDSKWNKTLELVMIGNMSHPLNVYRASEVIDWCNSPAFSRIMENDRIDHTVSNNCPNCGVPIIEGKKFCRNCGYQLIKD